MSLSRALLFLGIIIFTPTIVSGTDEYTDRIFYRTESGLTDVPDDIPAEAFEVRINDNQITSIRANVFSRLTLCTLLQLSNNAIFEIDLEAFGGLRNLKKLYLHDNQLSDVQAGTFTELINLRELHLYTNMFTILIPGIFNGLNNLQNLILNANQLTDIPSGTFSGLIHLQVLRLQGNQIDSLQPEDFSGLANLKELNLGDNKLADLQPDVFTGLSNLQNLYLYDNQLSALPSGIFTGLSNLQQIYLYNNQFTTLTSGIFNGLTNLHTLLLQKNLLTNIPDGLFRELGNLQILRLTSNHIESIQPEVFSGLSGLKELHLGENKLPTLQSGAFTELKNLQKLYLYSNLLTDIPSGIFSQLSTLQILRLYDNQITSSQPEDFSGLDTLKELHLGYNKMTDLQAGFFSELGNLKTLRLDGNLFTDLRPEMFTGLNHLEILGLAWCELRDVPSGMFSLFGNLKELYFHGNKFTELRKEFFTGLTSLKLLRLDQNPFTTIDSSVLSELPRPLTLTPPVLQCDSRLCWLKKEEEAGTIRWSNPAYSPTCADEIDWGTWTCSVQAECSQPPSILHAQRLGGSTVEHSLITYKCDSCYQGGGTILCQSNGQWTQTPTCTAIVCAEPGDLQNGVRNPQTGPFTCGRNILYTCNHGYYLVGNRTLLCGPSAQYDNPAPSCIKIESQCGTPPDVPHAQIIGTSSDMLTYSCDSCYHGGGVIQCQNNGQWTSVPSCTVKLCPEPGNLEHGVRNPSTGPFTCGSHVIYACNHGYELHGNGTLLCGDDAQYNGTAPTCKKPESSSAADSEGCDCDGKNDILPIILGVVCAIVLGLIIALVITCVHLKRHGIWFFAKSGQGRLVDGGYINSMGADLQHMELQESK